MKFLNRTITDTITRDKFEICYDTDASEVASVINSWNPESPEEVKTVIKDFAERITNATYDEYTVELGDYLAIKIDD